MADDGGAAPVNINDNLQPVLREHYPSPNIRIHIGCHPDLDLHEVRVLNSIGTYTYAKASLTNDMVMAIAKGDDGASLSLLFDIIDGLLAVLNLTAHQLRAATSAGAP